MAQNGKKSILGELLVPRSHSFVLTPPDYLSAYAREFWTELTDALGPAGMLNNVDAPALAILCENLADYWGLRRDLQELPLTEEIPVARRKQLVELRIKAYSTLRSLDGTLRSWLSEMLMTPASRARAAPVLAPPAEPEIDLSQLDADERAALREMLERRQERDKRLLQ